MACECFFAAVETKPDESDAQDNLLTPEVLSQTSELSIGTALPVINTALMLLNQSPVPAKKLRVTSWVEKKVRATSCALQKSLAGTSCSNHIVESQYFTEIIDALKAKYRTPGTTTEAKFQILTLLPKSWSVEKIVKEMGTTSYMAKVAKRMVQDGGILSTRRPKAGIYFLKILIYDIDFFKYATDLECSCNDELFNRNKSDFCSIVFNF